MGRTDRSKEGTRRNPNEGTSARTRAFSFEDIIMRRKKNQSNSNDKNSKIKDSLESANNTLDHTSPDRHQIMRASKDSVNERYKKEESALRRERDLIKRRYTGTHDLEFGTKMKSIHKKSNRDKESTGERYSHHSSKTSNFPAVSERLSGRKRLEDTEEKDTYDEHYRKSKRYRKGDSHNDDKARAENAKKSKKHDSARLPVTKYSERNGHKNFHIEPFYEDRRLIRSGSLECDPERGRSTSLSPLYRKDAYHTQEYGESYKDNSRKKHSDDDRYKTSGDVDRYKTSGDDDRYKASDDVDRYKASDDVDRYKTSDDVDRYKTSGDGGYSGGHHRKHGSGLGGYSPRKRKSEAAVKTPSPTVRSPERKVATWDQLPSGTNITSTGSIFTSFPLAASKVVESALSTTPATTKTYPVSSINSATMVVNASLESVQLTQATRPMRRLYIENLPPSAKEKAVIDCLNEILVSSGASHIQTKPCISCIINKDKAQALVEFLTPEDATAALSFDGNFMFGSVLKMRRPKDFIEAAIGVPEKAGDAVRIVSDIVMDSPYKIFVGGISNILSSEMLMEIASAFGPLKAYRSDFNRDLNGLCAFLEYEDHSITSKACAVLDGLTLGGRILTAVRACPDINGKKDNASPSYAVPPHAKPLLASVSQVLLLQNVINAEDLPTVPENELEETLEDIRLECARFGTVKAVHMVRHINSSNEPKSKAFELANSVNDSARLESNVNSHIGSTEKVDETHNEDITEASTSNYIGVIKEDEIQQETGPPEDLQDIGNGANVQTEESYREDTDLISNFSSPKEMQDTKLVEDANLNPVSAEKEEGKGDHERKLVEEGDARGSGELQAHVSDSFAPGCVLVEFQRKEAACTAAHCLHGRPYGELTVEVEYIPYDVYLKRFPK